jgi:Txe/YoeB family toxin of Txe-Axe toxin-antitoxin module
MYNILLTGRAVKDARKLEQSGLKPKAAALLAVLRENPYQNPPPYEKLRRYTDLFTSNQHSTPVGLSTAS